MDKNKELIKIFKEVFNITKNQDDFVLLSQNNLEQWDSLNHLNLIIKLEEIFELDISPEEMSELVSFQKIVDYLDNNKIK